MIKAFYSLSTALHDLKVGSAHEPPHSPLPSSPAVKEAHRWKHDGVVVISSSNIPPLPVEIIILIFEAGGTNRDIWISWSQVCRTWRWIAQMLLNRHVNLSTPALIDSFKNTLGLSESSLAPFSGSSDPLNDAELENSLRVCKVVQSIELGVADRALLSSSFSLLPLCPNLSEVRLIWRPTTEQSLPPTLDSKWANLRYLRSLYVDVVYQYAPHIVFHVIPHLPKLEVLGLNSQLVHPYPEPDLFTNPSLPRPSALTELHLPHLPPPAVLNWLLNKSSQTLQVLDLGRTAIIESTYGNILGAYGRNIRSLASHNGINVESYAVRQLINLEELIIRGPIAKNCLSRLPPTLQHLTFDFSSEQRSLPFVMKAVSEISTHNGLLRSIGYPYAAHPKDVEILREHCAKHGLLLRASDDKVPSVLARQRLYEKYSSHLLWDRTSELGKDKNARRTILGHRA